MSATTISTVLIRDAAVTTAKLADSAVTTAKIDDAAVDSDKLADASVILAKLGSLTTKGDLLTYSTTHARLAVGTDDQVLTADSSAADGLSWKVIPTQSPTTTKGDLIVHGASADARLPVGTDGQVLTADSGEADGVKWSTTAASGVAAADLIYGETPTGTVDGSNDTFTLANTPETGTLRLYKNGVRMNAGTGDDYTLSAGTITFESAAIPETGSVLLADYMKAQS